MGDSSTSSHGRLYWAELHKFRLASKVRDAEKTKDALNEVVNTMEDLMRLSSDHGIEERMYQMIFHESVG